MGRQATATDSQAAEPARGVAHVRDRRLVILAVAWMTGAAVLGFAAGYIRTAERVAPFPGVTKPAASPGALGPAAVLEAFQRKPKNQSTATTTTTSPTM